MTDTTLADLRVGQLVRAFHPRTLGVVHTAEVTKVGRKYVHLRFSVDGGRYHVLPKYVVGVA